MIQKIYFTWMLDATLRGKKHARHCGSQLLPICFVLYNKCILHARCCTYNCGHFLLHLVPARKRFLGCSVHSLFSTFLRIIKYVTRDVCRVTHLFYLMLVQQLSPYHCDYNRLRTVLMNVVYFLYTVYEK